MNKTIKNIHLITLKSNYHLNLSEDNAHFMDALFCTERLDFGGCSAAYVSQLAKSVKSEELEKVHINNLPLTINSNRDIDLPMIVLTNIIKDSFIDAKKLMDKIIEVARNNNWRSIRLTQLIELKSTNNANNFKGIIQSLLNNSDGKELTIFIDIDTRRYDDFCDLLDKHLN